MSSATTATPYQPFVIPTRSILPTTSTEHGSNEGDGTFNTVVDKYHGTELAGIPHATEAQMEEAIAAAYASRECCAR
jgi:hypothetical protein